MANSARPRRRWASDVWASQTLAAAAGTAHAQGSTGGVTYRCEDGNGRSTYTNVKEEMAGKKCTVVSREVSVVPVPSSAAPGGAPQKAAPRPASPAASSAPSARVDAATQRARDNDRRRILEDELRTAESDLDAAEKSLAAQEAVRRGDERNFQRVLERLKPFQDEVRRAEENVAALKRELASLR